MKRGLLVAIIGASVLLSSCKGENRPSPGGKNPPPSAGQVGDCSEFKEFSEVFQEMKKFESVLVAQADRNDRLAYASALLASHLNERYSVPKELLSNSREAQAYYLKYFSWVFTADGYVREKPTHPLTKECL